MSNKSVTVGFSVNPELHFSFSDGIGEKGFLHSLQLSLSGSSANVATCLRNMGENPLLLVPVEHSSTSVEGSLLNQALSQSTLPHSQIRVLKESPLAVYPIGERRPNTSLFYGKKGVVDRDMVDVELASTIETLDGAWRIATGVDANLAPLAEIFLSNESNYGRRTFSPHHTLCKDGDVLLGILGKTDLFILNEVEFKSLGMCFADIHKYGVSVVVVTRGAKGGVFSLRESGHLMREIAFSAYEPENSLIFEVGAGDWFNGALNTFFISNELPIYSATTSDMQEACNFAAKVAAKKITMKGGSNGPKKNDIC